VTRETQLALTDWLKGNLTDRLRTRNAPLVRKSTVENQTKVSTAGDVITGDLTLSIDNDERRLLGCQDLAPGKFLVLVRRRDESLML